MSNFDKTRFESYDFSIDETLVNQQVDAIRRTVPERGANKQLLKRCLASIDLTTLNPTDGSQKAKTFAQNVSRFPQHFADLPNVAAICVYPPLVSEVREHLDAPEVKIAAVAAGFPSSQTFIDVKLAECRQTLAQGADELDVVISCGPFLEGDYELVYNELAQIKKLAGAHRVKVILETGVLPTLSHVKRASFLAMEAGADFIKTSTGKVGTSATPQAVYAMCLCINEFYKKTGRMVGIKPAGGMSVAHDALLYYSIVEKILGDAWLNPTYFRLGASRLANNLLSEIQGKDIKYF